MKSRIIAIRLLRQRAELLALLGGDAEKIVAGNIPAGALPGVGVTHVSGVEPHQPLTGGISAKVDARVQVTVQAKDLKRADLIMDQCRYALRNFVGAIPGVPGVTSVRLVDAQGEFESNDGSFIILTQDARVIFTDSP